MHSFNKYAHMLTRNHCYYVHYSRNRNALVRETLNRFWGFPRAAFHVLIACRRFDLISMIRQRKVCSFCHILPLLNPQWIMPGGRITYCPGSCTILYTCTPWSRNQRGEQTKRSLWRRNASQVSSASILLLLYKANQT